MQRLDFAKASPAAYKALLGVEKIMSANPVSSTACSNW